ncbi:MAG: thioredoxin family protein [Chitinophagaceae bacterium]
MNKLILCIICILSANATIGQTQYKVSYDSTRKNVKVLTGIIDKYLVLNDTAFTWYASNHKGYTLSDSSILKAFQKSKDSVQYIVFGGTWCEDTQNILPKFFKIQEKAGVADNRITFFGVDENKKSLGNITTAMNIKNVPTIIVMKHGKEIGRVVEYGSTGKWDKELADILSK